MSGGSDLDAVLAADAARCSALVAGDVDALGALLTDDLVFVHSSGNRDDKDRVLRAVGSGAVVYESIDVAQVAGRIVGDVAYLTGDICLKVVNRGEPVTVDNHFLSVWVRDQDRWQLAAFQGTKRPQAG